ncbi:MAG: hypothetical protein A3B96_04030 [Candidatus Spechtbacteria bacterium RIFCSPHIGHO2_02_FULL_43_15b]|nr:MAG: hypothetical protein A3B96_04030 [Candidatus Spechtbacteria bacterium RIFCSPHIGHO2_02_FULL_43_15b]
MRNLRHKSAKKIIICDILFIGTILAFGAFYLFSANSLTSDGFAIDEMRSAIKNLNQEYYSLSVYAMDAKSIKNLERRVKDLNLERVDQVSYIKAKSSSPLVLGN